MSRVTQELGRILLDFVETFIMAAAIFIVVYMFLLQPHHVQGQSMLPTFHDNDYILTDKITYRFRNPERGDIIVFRAPQNPRSDYIKRIVALPGEKIKIDKGHFYISTANGKYELLPEPYIATSVGTEGGNLAHEDEEIIVPQDQYFVAGDNRNHSSDSRDWGTVPKESIVGRAWFRYWPPQNMGLIRQVSYQF